MLDLDQENAGLSYREPSNAKWIEYTEEEIDHEVLFYPELMIPKNLPSPVSPFIATAFHHKDLEKYQSDEAARRYFKTKIWPTLQRVYTHFEKQNCDLMDKESESIAVEVPVFDNLQERGEWLQGLNRHYFNLFIEDPGKFIAIERVAALAHGYHPRIFKEFALEYVKSGRMLALWKEIKSIRRQFLNLYESLLPLLMMGRYWKDEEKNIAAYDLSVKNFEDLKGLYIDCVETAYRLMVVGLGMELIAKSGKVVVPTTKGDRNIWWFEQVSNGVKDTQFQKYALFDGLRNNLDLSLRNGVGHHSAHYDVSTDQVIYVKADEANLTEHILPYTEFVEKTFLAYCAFEVATGFFQWLFAAGGGRLS